MSDLIDNNFLLVLIIILFVFITYLQRQVNQLSQATENFADTNTVTTENLNAITNLGNLADSILSKNALNISSELKVNDRITINSPTNTDKTALCINDGAINIYGGYLGIHNTKYKTDSVGNQVKDSSGKSIILTNTDGRTVGSDDPVFNADVGSMILWSGDIKLWNGDFFHRGKKVAFTYA